MKVIQNEKRIGIEVFYNQDPGLGGRLRYYPEDFKVTEISNYPKEKTNGRFTIAEISSVNWETNQLVKEISNKLHMSRQRIGFAGTKDKRAKTKQLMSFYKTDVEKLKEVRINDIIIENIYTSDKPVKTGNLVGNNFDITIRNVDKRITKENIDKITNFFKEKGGFPNYFGVQRFGIIRPITHTVGKFIVKGDFEKAVLTYLAEPFEDEDEEIFNLRNDLKQTYDFAEALKRFPNKLNYEKAMLNALINEPEDFIKALKQLPKNLLTMFVYAYQSYLFNKILSERLKKEIPINEACIGDIILPVRKNIIEQENIFTTERNIEKINKQISKGKAFVSGVLFGTDTIFSDGIMGEIERDIINKEKIDPRDFIIPDMPYLSSSGLRRALIAPVDNLYSSILEDNVVNLKFDLKKGCYATCLLREYMKADNIKVY